MGGVEVKYPQLLNLFIIQRLLVAQEFNFIDMAVFWVVAPCSLIQVYRRFRGAWCLRHQGDEWFCLSGYHSHKLRTPCYRASHNNSHFFSWSINRVLLQNHSISTCLEPSKLHLRSLLL
jgi:hypothetical protein